MDIVYAEPVDVLNRAFCLKPSAGTVIVAIFSRWGGDALEWEQFKNHQDNGFRYKAVWRGERFQNQEQEGE